MSNERQLAYEGAQPRHELGLAVLRDLPLERERAAVRAHPLVAAWYDAAAAEPESWKLPDYEPAVEIGGPDGPDPTRYGDWERKGRAIDF